jgi:hypothetical protein
MTDRWIVCAADDKVRNLDGKMEISNLPGESSCPPGVAAQLNLKNRLGRLRNYVALSGLPVKNGSVRQAMIDIEAELPSILSQSAPAPLCEGHTIRNQNDHLLTGTRWMLTS